MIWMKMNKLVTLHRLNRSARQNKSPGQGQISNGN